MFLQSRLYYGLALRTSQSRIVEGEGMLAKVTSCAVIGLDGAIVEVEVDTSRGLPSLTIVGLPDAAVQESRERVRAAIKNSGVWKPLPGNL